MRVVEAAGLGLVGPSGARRHELARGVLSRPVTTDPVATNRFEDHLRDRGLLGGGEGIRTPGTVTGTAVFKFGPTEANDSKRLLF